MIKLPKKIAILMLCASITLCSNAYTYAGVLDSILNESEEPGTDTPKAEPSDKEADPSAEDQETKGSESEPEPQASPKEAEPAKDPSDSNKEDDITDTDDNITGQAVETKEAFSDIKGHWARSRILDGVKAGYVSGYSDGTFRPDNTVTRAEFATMLNKALKNNKNTLINFKDVNKSDWYYEQVGKSVAAGLFSGGIDNTFRPQSPITRQEAAKVIACAMTSATIDGDGATLMSDYEVISDWAKESVNAAANKGYINGYPEGLYKPSKALTRAEAVKIIGDILDNENIEYGFNVTEAGEVYRDAVVVGDVKVLSSVGAGEVTVSNVTVLGDIVISGSGVTTVVLSDVRLRSLRVEDAASNVQIVCENNVYIDSVSLSGSASVVQQGTNIVINNGLN